MFTYYIIRITLITFMILGGSPQIFAQKSGTGTILDKVLGFGKTPKPTNPLLDNIINPKRQPGGSGTPAIPGIDPPRVDGYFYAESFKGRIVWNPGSARIEVPEDGVLTLHIENKAPLQKANFFLRQAITGRCLKVELFSGESKFINVKRALYNHTCP